jgi:transposase
MMVYRWIQLQSEKPASPAAHAHDQEARPVKSMAPRHLAWLFLRTPGRLEKQEQEALLSLLLKAEPVKIVYPLAQRLVTMIKERNAQALDTWLLDCQKSGISDLVTFAASGWRKKDLLSMPP